VSNVSGVLSCTSRTDVELFRCDAQPDNLDDFHAHLRSHEKTDFLLEAFSPGIVWDEYGLRSDVVVSYIPLYSTL
jgi:hypothetical protein